MAYRYHSAQVTFLVEGAECSAELWAKRVLSGDKDDWRANFAKDILRISAEDDRFSSLSEGDRCIVDFGSGRETCQVLAVGSVDEADAVVLRRIARGGAVWLHRREAHKLLEVAKL